MNPKANKLEDVVTSLRLKALDSMQESIEDFYSRVPSPGHSKREKRLYAELGHIFMFAPAVMVPTLLDLLGTVAASKLKNTSLNGEWRAYRLSTKRLNKGWTGPLCFPGAAGQGHIADIGLFMNSSFDGADGGQVRAEKILYFEVKSSDSHRHNRKQLKGHLRDLKDIGFLVAIGGRPMTIDHPRWLGHVSLHDFSVKMSQVAVAKLKCDKLAKEIEGLLPPKKLRQR